MQNVFITASGLFPIYALETMHKSWPSFLRHLSYCVLVAVCAAIPRSAFALSVSLDWSGVSDEVIEQCELMGLENLLVQNLLEAGHALVQESDDIAIRLKVELVRPEISGGGEGEPHFVIVTTRGVDKEIRQLHIPASCDSTIQLDVIQAMLDAVSVLAARGQPIGPTPELGGIKLIQRSPWHLSVGAGASIPGSSFVLPQLVMGTRYDLDDSFALGGGFETAFGYWGGVLVVEPGLFAEILAQTQAANFLFWRAGLRASVLVHIYDADVDAGSEVDARLAVVLEVATESLSLTIMPHLRRLALDHVFANDIAYTSRHWGIMVVGSVWLF